MKQSDLLESTAQWKRQEGRILCQFPIGREDAVKVVQFHVSLPLPLGVAQQDTPPEPNERVLRVHPRWDNH